MTYFLMINHFILLKKARRFDWKLRNKIVIRKNNSKWIKKLINQLQLTFFFYFFSPLNCFLCYIFPHWNLALFYLYKIKQTSGHKLPCCHQMNEEDHQLCNSLIIFKSVKNFLKDSTELFESFEKVILKWSRHQCKNKRMSEWILRWHYSSIEWTRMLCWNIPQIQFKGFVYFTKETATRHF